MIRKFLQKQIAINAAKFNFSSNHHAAGPSKLQKAEKKLIYLYIRNNDSVYQKVPAFEGDSLYETIVRNQVKSFESNTCDGYDATYRPHYRPHDPFSDGPQCGGCRVILQDNWYERVNAETQGMSQQEIDLLQQTQRDLQSKTRLACCIPIESWMDGMTLRIDPEPTEGSLSTIF